MTTQKCVSMGTIHFHPHNWGLKYHSLAINHPKHSHLCLHQIPGTHSGSLLKLRYPSERTIKRSFPQPRLTLVHLMTQFIARSNPLYCSFRLQAKKPAITAGFPTKLTFIPASHSCCECERRTRVRLSSLRTSGIQYSPGH